MQHKWTIPVKHKPNPFNGNLKKYLKKKFLNQS